MFSSIGAIFLPFGTLLTGSTIGTNNEKSTKVWTGDTENEPVQLVTYNADGTLPSNQIYDDVVTDVNITAPAIVDINSNNHATMTYSTKTRTKLTLSLLDPTNICKEVYKLNKYTDLFVCSSSSPYTTGAYELNEDEFCILEYQENSGLCADISCDISGYYPNTILVIGHNDNSNGYCFINTENKKISNYKTIELTSSGEAYDVTKDNGSYLYYYDGRIYLLNAGYNIKEFTITGQTLEELSITLTNTIQFSDTGNYYVTALQMNECGYSNKILVLCKEYYYVITLSPDNLSVSERKNLGSNNAWRNNRLYSIAPPKWLNGYKEYFFITTDGKIYDSTAGRTGLQWTRFRFNGTEITDIISQSSNSFFTNRSLSIQDYIQISPSEIIAIYHENSSSSASLRALYINTTTNVYFGGFNLPDAVRVNYGEGYRRMSIPSGPNIYLCGMVNGSFSINSLYPYFDYTENTIKCADYAVNSSTKALAVTSGNIGDTVRIAYEGTYNVPGVPSGAIYNTDTSYAIAKKSGVLTVSEPQQISKVYYGSYVGDGTRGKSESNPMSITFPFEPKMIWMVGYTGNTALPAMITSIDDINSGSVKVDISKVTEDFSTDGGWRVVPDFTVYHKVSSDRKIYYWYIKSSSINAKYLFNAAEVTYYYVAFG